MTTVSKPVPPPPWQTPVTDPRTGQLTQPWMGFFQALFKAAGGGGGGGGSGGGSTQETVAWFTTPNIDEQAIQQNIDGATAIALMQPVVEPAGANGFIQFNTAGNFDASADLTYARTSTDSVLNLQGVTTTVTQQADGAGFAIDGRDALPGGAADTFSFLSGNDFEYGAMGAKTILHGGSNVTGGSLDLIAGDVNDLIDPIGTGGDVNITAGTVSLTDETIVGLGGSVVIKSGQGAVNGAIVNKIGDENALTINSNRAFGIGSTTDYGVNGRILTTHGALQEPTWEARGVAEIRFDYGDATPKNLYIIDEDKTVLQVSIVILTEFDDPTATLSVGDADDAERLLTITDNIPSQLGTYTTDPAYQYLSTSTITLSISPGTSTQGSGLVVITYQQ